MSNWSHFELADVEQCSKRSPHFSLKALEADLKARKATWNENPRPFVRRTTADDILESLGAYCM